MWQQHCCLCCSKLVVLAGLAPADHMMLLVVEKQAMVAMSECLVNPISYST
jgi:hypothetical protein